VHGGLDDNRCISPRGGPTATLDSPVRVCRDASFLEPGGKHNCGAFPVVSNQVGLVTMEMSILLLAGSNLLRGRFSDDHRYLSLEWKQEFMTWVLIFRGLSCRRYFQQDRRNV
jgi:hypothetical protein